MQEEIENRSATLVISASKLTLRVLQDATKTSLRNENHPCGWFCLWRPRRDSNARPFA